ncbi:MAG: hypothetical protein ABL986_20275 [Vicinamibacterales bacterium]
MSPLTTVFERCERENISYCVLRDAEDAGSQAAGEVDLLVAPGDLPRLTSVLVDAGFVRLASWGRSPHRFFIRYDPVEDSWLKCDVVTEVAFGRPVHNLRTTLGASCLAGRRRVGATYAPGVEDELIALLLHEMLDKGAFREHRIARLKVLRGQVSDERRLTSHLSRYWPGQSWPRLSDAIARDGWEKLLSERSAVSRAIAQHAPLRTALTGVRDRGLRSLFRLAGLFRPNAPSLALLAPDGAGKSTLTSGIESRFFGPVCPVYMGLYQASAVKGRGKTPGLGLAGLLATQWRRYGKARYRQAAGQLVLFDRYSYDALLPVRGKPTLLRRVRRWLLAWTVPAPSLTVVLDAPGDMLFARKGEHTADLLESQRQAYLAISRRLSRVAVVDAQLGPDHVRRTVTNLVWNEYQRRASSTATASRSS